MSKLIHIIGVSGAGKSTVLTELKKRGLEAYGVDEDGFQTFNPNDWSWKLDEERIVDLRSHKDAHVFLCGSEGKLGYIHLFDKIFALVVDWPTIRQRLQSRSDGWGKNTDELTNIKSYFDQSGSLYEALDAIMIDATKPIDEIVNSILLNLTHRGR